MSITEEMLKKLQNFPESGDKNIQKSQCMDLWAVISDLENDAVKIQVKILSTAITELADILQAFANSQLTQPLSHQHYVDLSTRARKIRDKVKLLEK